jgi:WD repeat-containing protein 23
LHHYNHKLISVNKYVILCSVFFSADRNLRLYQTTEGKFEMLKIILARDVGWSVLDTAFSPDGNYVVYSSWSECRKFLKIMYCKLIAGFVICVVL